MVLLPGFAF